MLTIYDQAFALLKTKDAANITQAFDLFKAEVTAHPTDAKALFEYAGAFDYMDREAEARPIYEQVIQSGYERLPAEDQPRLFIQLGSTLRNLKVYDRSREILQTGIHHFPKNKALKAFLALTEHSAGNPTRAASLLFEALLEVSQDSSIQDYARALTQYAKELVR